MYLIYGPRQRFFFQCGPETPKGWTLLHQRKFRNFLHTKTFRYDQCWYARGCQGRADGISPLCCDHSVMPTALGFFWFKHVAPMTHIFKSTLARMMSPTPLNLENLSHSSASTLRLSTVLITCQFTDITGLSAVVVQVDANKVHDTWLNGSLEYSRQSDIVAR